MKKIYSIIMIALLLLACPITAYADTGIYKTGQYYFIGTGGYDNLPDCVCGVWRTNFWDSNDAYPDYWIPDVTYSNDYYYGNITYAIQNTKEGNEMKQEILDFIEEDSTISFVYQKYGYNYLRQIQDELLPYFDFGKIGMVSTCVMQLDNRVEVQILTEKKNDKNTQKILDELTQKYQDAIYFVYVDDYPQLEDIGYNPTTDSNSPMINYMPYFFLLCAATIILVFGFLIKLKERNTLVMQTTDKKTITVSNPLTTKEAEEMIKKSNIAVPQDLDDKIMNTIHKKIDSNR